MSQGQWAACDGGSDSVCTTNRPRLHKPVLVVVKSILFALEIYKALTIQGDLLDSKKEERSKRGSDLHFITW